MPTARQTIGARDLKTIVDACEPPCEGASDSQKRAEYLNTMQNLCELMVDACVRRRNGNIDDWGYVETVQSFKTSIQNVMRGARG
jgi:hypothetical protein